MCRSVWLGQAFACAVAACGRGAFATRAYELFDNATTVEHIVAHAGMDIGDTFIGMHLKAVAVPFRGSAKADRHGACVDGDHACPFYRR